MTKENIYKITETENIFKNLSINLIDFGMAKRYYDNKTQKYTPEHTVDVFAGNIFGASIN